jgi:hypothetical protein
MIFANLTGNPIPVESWSTAWMIQPVFILATAVSFWQRRHWGILCYSVPFICVWFYENKILNLSHLVPVLSGFSSFTKLALLGFFSKPNSFSNVPFNLSSFIYLGFK